MIKAKKRVLVLFLWILLGLIIAIIVGYFIYTYLKLNNDDIPIEKFSGNVYINTDEKKQLIFDSDATSITIITETSSAVYTVEYEENIFTLTGDDIVYVIVLDEQTLFDSAGTYYNLIEETD